MAHLQLSMQKTLSRRSFFRGTCGAGLALLLVSAPSACVYQPGEGVAWEPWNFPEDVGTPEWAAVAGAILASSPHNTQPWKFSVSPTTIDLYADMSRSLGAMDGLNREMMMGLGCALENLVVTAKAYGRDSEVELLSQREEVDGFIHIARVTLNPGEAEETAAFLSIPHRRTNRGPYANTPSPADLETLLLGLITEEENKNIHIRLLTDRQSIKRFGKETVAATQAIVADTEMNETSHSWFRHTSSEVGEHRDGITMDMLGLSRTIAVLAKAGSPPNAEVSGQYWVDATRDIHTSASAVCFLATRARANVEQQIQCGRVYQRIALWAAHSGLAIHPLNQMPERQDREQILGLTPTFTNVLAALQNDTGFGTQLCCRMGYAWDPAYHSVRRPVNWVTS